MSLNAQKLLEGSMKNFIFKPSISQEFVHQMFSPNSKKKVCEDILTSSVVVHDLPKNMVARLSDFEIPAKRALHGEFTPFIP